MKEPKGGDTGSQRYFGAGPERTTSRVPEACDRPDPGQWPARVLAPQACRDTAVRVMVVAADPSLRPPLPAGPPGPELSESRRRTGCAQAGRGASRASRAGAWASSWPGPGGSGRPAQLRKRFCLGAGPCRDRDHRQDSSVPWRRAALRAKLPSRAKSKRHRVRRGAERCARPLALSVLALH
jgi:hypothetical protein